MSDDLFNVDDFVDKEPEAKLKAQPEEYNHNEFIIEVSEEPIIAKDGSDGLDGKDGLDGQKGSDGLSGIDGLDGLNGSDGADGVSVVDTFVQNDDLLIRLSDGKLINAGNVRGKQGKQGYTGSGGGKGYRGGGVKKDMFVQDTQPDTNDPYMWLQTNVNSKGDFSLWFNQC